MSAVKHPCIKCDAARVYSVGGARGRALVEEVASKYPEKVGEAVSLVPCECRTCGKRFVIGLEVDDIPRQRAATIKRKVERQQKPSRRVRRALASGRNKARSNDGRPDQPQ